MIKLNEHKYFPWFTVLFSLLLIVVYVIMAVLSKSLIINFNLLEYFGAPYATKIYLGHVYGVVLNNLIHIHLIHLFSNLLGLWLFVAFLERRIGWAKTASFGLVCSIFGSIVQLAFSNDPGLGIASAIYGYYALILVMSFQDEQFKMKYQYVFGAILMLSIVVMMVTNNFFGYQVAIEGN